MTQYSPIQSSTAHYSPTSLCGSVQFGMAQEQPSTTQNSPTEPCIAPYGQVQLSMAQYRPVWWLNTVQYGPVPCCTDGCGAVNPIWLSTAQYRPLQFHMVLYIPEWHRAAKYSPIQPSMAQYSPAQSCTAPCGQVQPCILL